MAKYIIDTSDIEKIEEFVAENGKDYNDFTTLLLDLFDENLVEFED